MFTKRNDPLIGPAQAAIEYGNNKRKIEREVLEELGTDHMNGLTNENRAKFKDEVLKRVSNKTINESKKEYDKSHGGPFDRGGADAYYGRKGKPHYYKDKEDGTRDIINAEHMTPDEIEAYHAGYSSEPDKKDWGTKPKSKPKVTLTSFKEAFLPRGNPGGESSRFIKMKKAEDKQRRKLDKIHSGLSDNELKDDHNHMKDRVKDLKNRGAFEGEDAARWFSLKAEMQKRGFLSEEEQLDEISKETLVSYTKKASKDKENLNDAIDGIYGRYGKSNGESKLPSSLNYYKNKIKRRNKGLSMASDKLMKEEQLDEAKESFAKQIRDNCSVDSVGKAKNADHYVVRRGFYYSHGGTAEKFADHVSANLKKAGIDHEIIDKGEVWKPFNGGASVANQSHWYVHIKPGKKKVEESTQLDKIVNEIKSKGIDIDKILDEGRAGGIPITAKRPIGNDSTRSHLGDVNKRYLQMNGPISDNKKNNEPVSPQTNNNQPAKTNSDRPPLKTLNGPRKETPTNIPKKETPAAATTTNQQAPATNVRDSAPAPVTQKASVPVQNNTPVNNQAPIKKDPTDTAENRKFKATYAADRTMNGTPSEGL